MSFIIKVERYDKEDKYLGYQIMRVEADFIKLSYETDSSLLERVARQDELHEIQFLKDALLEIYRLRGEDPEIKRICDKAL